MHNQVPTDTHQENTLRRFSWVLSLVFLIVMIGVLYISLFSKRDNISEQTSTLENQTQISPQEKTKVDPAEKERQGMLDYFLSDIYPQYQTFNAEVEPNLIKRVFPFALKEIGDSTERGWLVEVESAPNEISHYLLTPIIEKKLVDSRSCVSEDENPPIKLEKVDTVGNERNLGRDLEEKSGYLILSGTENTCYGGAGTGFVSVYNIRTGEKIKLQGAFENPGTIQKGVSQTGNALGILRGIYGITEPTIVVEYGSFESAASAVEQIRAVAYFDLQTGKLKQLITFQ